MIPAAPAASRRRFRAAEVAGFAVLAFVPFLLSAPGQVSADTKQYLYLDPGGLLARAVYLWDPSTAAGSVPHQQIGYLFPMGPFFWLLDQAGVPDWVAQRLWLGLISLAAGLGARWLLRTLGVGRAGAIAGALVYMLTPYQLAFTARMSVLLLPWAALPWVVGLTMRAVRTRRWFEPALIALCVLVVGGVSASALMLVAIAPVLALLLGLLHERDVRGVATAAARIGVLTLGVSLWWIAGLRLQGAYGLPVLQLTENLRTITGDASPDDVLRGIGNWFFYGSDRLGDSIDQAASYRDNEAVRLTTFLVPAVALLAALLVRWRYRAYFAALIIVGTVIAVGAWPYSAPTPLGVIWKRLAEDSSIGLALRNTPRAVPLVVLGCAALIGGAVAAIRPRRVQVGAAVAVGALALAALAPVWRDGFLSDRLRRPEDVPSYWTEAAAALDRRGDDSRVLEVPGVNFAAYRWGNTVDPVTPGLTDRPYLAREVLPAGTPALVNLLDALDRRMQEGTFEPASLAPVARLLGVGTIALRSDLQYERFETPRPRSLWAQLTAPVPGGLRAAETFGAPEPNVPVPTLPMLDEIELRTATDAPHPPPVALFDVEDPMPLAAALAATRPVVLEGDGDGIVDAAAAGLLDGRSLLLQPAALDDEALDQALGWDADLVLTDSNRRRAQTWFYSLRDTKGPTERAGETAPDVTGYDFRLEPFPGATDDSRSVVEHVGGKATATLDGGPPRPEDRAVHAFDGDIRTSWRIGGPDPRGHRITLETAEPVDADHVTVVQPQDGPRDRVLDRVRLRFDGGDTIDAALDESSLTPEGQEIRFAPRTVRLLEVELLSTTTPPFDPGKANAVGFAEIRLGDVTVAETVRLPTAMSARVGARAVDHRLDVVLSRLRYEPGARGRLDPEPALDRTFDLSPGRTFTVAGTARINPNAPDHVLDEVLGTTAEGAAFTASGHLAGDAEARASRAFDADPATAWTSPFGPQEGAWLEVRHPAPVTVSRVDLDVVDGGRHSLPTRLRLEVDGRPAATLTIPPADGGTATVSFEPVTGTRLRLVVEAVDRRTPRPGDPNPLETLPVALAEVRFDAAAPMPEPADLPDACRDDLLQVDGRPVGVRLRGGPEDARTGLAVETCDGPVELDAGTHRVRAAVGLDTGVDVDRLVLMSDAGGGPGATAARGEPATALPADVHNPSPVAWDLDVEAGGEPFWVVLSQSNSRGWDIDVENGDGGERRLVNGYANGWVVTPGGTGPVAVSLDWTPQRIVWVALAGSAVAAIACLGIVVAGVRRRATITLADAPSLLPWRRRTAPLGWAATAGLAAVVAIATMAASRPWIAAVAAVATAVVARVPIARPVLVAAVPAAVLASFAADEPALAWLALALLGADLTVAWWQNRPPPAPPAPAGPPPLPT